jgi:hypothetical protein
MAAGGQVTPLVAIVDVYCPTIGGRVPSLHQLLYIYQNTRVDLTSEVLCFHRFALGWQVVVPTTIA